jgi:hypothetical protein
MKKPSHSNQSRTIRLLDLASLANVTGGDGEDEKKAVFTLTYSVERFDLQYKSGG